MAEKIAEEIARINQANARVINLYCAWVKKKGMNYNEFLMYYTLLEGKKTQKQLSERTHLIKQTVNNIVKQMESQGYVRFEDSTENYKEKYVVLTEKGFQKAHAVADELITIENSTVARMGKDRIELLGSLSVLFGNMLEEEMHF